MSGSVLQTLVVPGSGSNSQCGRAVATLGSTYQLCFYDDLFVTPDLTIDLAIPSGALCDGLPCWRRSGTSGFAYKDPDRTPSGIEKVVIQVKDAQGRIAVSGRGGRLGFPVMDVHDPFPFNFGWSVVMVDGSSGQCWAAGSGAIQNQRGKYKGTARGS